MRNRRAVNDYVKSMACYASMVALMLVVFNVADPLKPMFVSAQVIAFVGLLYFGLRRKNC